jgi:hypothetical protein
MTLVLLGLEQVGNHALLGYDFKKAKALDMLVLLTLLFLRKERQVSVP